MTMGVASMDSCRTPALMQWIFANVNSDATLAQTLTDVIGESYTFSFWLETIPGTPSDFSALFDATVLLSESNPSYPAYTQFSYTVVGTGSDTISFNGLDKPSDIGLDDVSFCSG